MCDNAETHQKYPRGQRLLYPTACWVFTSNFVNKACVQAFFICLLLPQYTKKNLIFALWVLQKFYNTRSYSIFQIGVVENFSQCKKCKLEVWSVELRLQAGVEEVLQHTLFNI